MGEIDGEIGASYPRNDLREKTDDVVEFSESDGGLSLYDTNITKRNVGINTPTPTTSGSGSV